MTVHVYYVCFSVFTANLVCRLYVHVLYFILSQVWESKIAFWDICGDFHVDENVLVRKCRKRRETINNDLREQLLK